MALVHSITWSARSSNAGGIVRPRRLGGPEVHDQLELRGLLDGEIPRLGSLEDLVYVGRRRRYISGTLGP